MTDKEILDAMRSMLEPIKDDIQSLKTGQAAMQADVSDIKQRVTGIEVIQENVTNKHIGLLMDGHTGIIDKLRTLEDLPDKVDDIQMTVSILKQAVKK